MTAYRIDLVPLERFFFGGENTFGEKNSENYYVRSNYYPQQTTLLGTLRYLLLKSADGLMDKDGKIIDGKEGTANGLIGINSFDTSNHSDGYGKIKKLSPVFVTGPDGDYLAQSREFALNWIEDEISGKQRQGIVPLKYRKQKGQSFLAGNKNFIPYLEGLKAKTVFPHILLNLSNKQMRYSDFSIALRGNPMTGIFIEEEQIGINKKEKENGFYKQVGFRMLDGYGFGFYAEFVEGFNKIQSKTIKMGADKSWFNVSVAPIKNNDSTYELFMNQKPTNIFQYPNSPSGKIVLLSDTYIERDFFNRNIDFALAGTYIFKYLQTNRRGIGKKFKNEKAKFYMDKSTQNYELLKKGSVLFVDYARKEKILKEITGNGNTAAAFHQVGYNYAI
ncbi:MAG: type III-B CRISPR module-associated Cmr3 family protein [Flavobacteriaceae bacterium]|nr:type III-B CRISPR module-associated Cmr3 family protein [Flavobacteriaceae bacterium]